MPQPTSTSSHAGEFTRRPIKESRTVALKAAGLLTRISGAALCGCSTPLCDRSPRGIALGCGSFRLAAVVTSDRAAWSSSTRLRYRRACTASLVSFPAELHAHPAWRPPAACSRRHRRAVARRDLTLVAHRPAILEALSALRSLDRGQQPHQAPQQHQRGPTHPAAQWSRVVVLVWQPRPLRQPARGPLVIHPTPAVPKSLDRTCGAPAGRVLKPLERRRSSGDGAILRDCRLGQVWVGAGDLHVHTTRRPPPHFLDRVAPAGLKSGTACAGGGTTAGARRAPADRRPGRRRPSDRAAPTRAAAVRHPPSQSFHRGRPGRHLISSCRHDLPRQLLVQQHVEFNMGSGEHQRLTESDAFRSGLYLPIAAL